MSYTDSFPPLTTKSSVSLGNCMSRIWYDSNNVSIPTNPDWSSNCHMPLEVMIIAGADTQPKQNQSVLFWELI